MDNILILSCCAPCSATLIRDLLQQKVNFTILFYNPNIKPFEEYQKRMNENRDLCRRFNVPFVEAEYDTQRWDMLTKGLENEPERGKRCSVCFSMRLRKGFEYARENGFDAVASVFGFSRYKDNQQVLSCANKIATEFNIPYIDLDGRIDDVYVKELQLYRQRYCGCKPR